ncbi:4-oxalocrotonate tautomerase family protein [Pseudomonas sp. TH05]|nr:4-oxalocrotonate tautomerase family protein [Pseudomonas sp. TH07]MBK5558127.1 4-oxalocrotonate tautomerase family protein [Pseudomonas sp. TH05]OOV89169.1 4-oxalocrotonate tautomerase [Pseudomonas sp. MF4836]
MPYINLQITKGASREQKAQLVKEFTDSLVRILGKKPEQTHIVIQEIDPQDWGFRGLLSDEPED